jgi:hypothetical protein
MADQALIKVICCKWKRHPRTTKRNILWRHRMQKKKNRNMAPRALIIKFMYRVNLWTEISVTWISNAEWCSHPKPKYAWSIYYINNIDLIVSPVTSTPPHTVIQLTTTTLHYAGKSLSDYLHNDKTTISYLNILL